MQQDAHSGKPRTCIQISIILLIHLLSIFLSGCGLEDSQPIIPSVTFFPTSMTVLTPVSTPTAQTASPSPVPPTATQTLTPTVATVEIGFVNVGAAYLRAGPAIQNRIVGYVYDGDQLLILGHSEDAMWLQIEYQEEAWISASLVNVSQVTVTPMEDMKLTATSEITNTITMTPSD